MKADEIGVEEAVERLDDIREVHTALYRRSEFLRPRNERTVQAITLAIAALREVGELRAALRRMLDAELGSLCETGDPARGAQVEADCPHHIQGDYDACPWSDVHERVAQIRVALHPQRTEEPKP